MTPKILLLSLSLLLIVKGKLIFCARHDSALRETKSYYRCTRQYQDECGTGRITLYDSPGLFEATYDTISDVCEDGTLLNLVVTENLKCFNDTFGKTNCLEEAEDFVTPLIERLREDKNHENTVSISCLEEIHSSDCVLRAVFENCGKIVGEATYEIILRSKTIEYSCKVAEAQSVLDAMENLDLSEDKKQSFTALLEKLLEEKSN
ncbi:unnamed protein product [Larinioides sclopetarius]|uniref:Uncharacterized protein n=1 Tax=Larinioides sclopetarius TaxID=280406 RepID=A0AAV2BM67_9ARAC